MGRSIVGLGEVREMEGFGSYLRGQREARKISLREISRVTRISRSILEALERDHRELLLPEVVVKGFIEAYARYCGMDPQEVLSRYAKGQAKNGAEEKGFARDEKQGIPLKYIFAGAAGVTIVIIAALISLPSGRTPHQGAQDTALAKDVPRQRRIIAAQTEQTTIPAAIPRPTTAPLSARDDAQEQPGQFSPVREHILVLRASERTWIQVQDGKAPPFDVILSRGENYTRKSPHPVTIVVGNAGNVTATFDGKGLGILGKGGEVVKRTFPAP